jgi:peptide-methionine (S)-S-oxide reductase
VVWAAAARGRKRLNTIETATFAAGCFWSVEEAFRQLNGVTQTSVGYMGGHFANPCHLDVAARITGHAEVAQVKFDPKQVSYEALLAVFWEIHDPTSLNRQGADRGEQYRSAIFYHSPEQQRLAIAAKQSLERLGRYDRAIVTQIEMAGDYWLAKEEHQQYILRRRSKQGDG